MESLKGKNVLIAGATGGIGAQTDPSPVYIKKDPHYTGLYRKPAFQKKI